MRATILLLTLTLLTSCASTPEKPEGTTNAKDGELGNQSYIPYQYVHTNPPDKILPPPTFITAENGEYTYYNENELVAYADALVEYHRYLERYIGSMEGSDGKPLVDIGGSACLDELRKVTILEPPPRRPIPPTYSSVEKAEGSDLMVNYLNEVDRWIESLEQHHQDSVKEFNQRLTRLKTVCGE